MSHSPLPNRLSNLSESHRVTLSLINRLSKLSIQPNPSSPVDDGDARVELTTEIHQGLKEQEDTLELLKQEVDDYVTRARGAEKERERARLEASVARIGEDLQLARSQFRKAQLQAKRNAENSQRKERELLFSRSGSSSGDSQGRRRGQEKLSQDELLANASEQSTAALATLSEGYSSLDSLLSSSRSLLGTLLRTQKSDTWYLETAFYILLSTVIWLFFRRILYGPLWWFVWLPLKVLYWALGTTVGLAARSTSLRTPASLQETTVTSARVMATQHSARGDRPTFATGQSVSVVVGGGGRGRPGPGGTPSPSSSRVAERSATEEVERIIDESQEQQQQGEKESEEGKEEGKEEKKAEGEGEKRMPNPKKRMWEEDIGPRKEEERKKDEL